MFNTDKFIACVQATPVLWDKTLKSYYNKIARKQAWAAVGEAFNEKWAHLNAHQKEFKGEIHFIFVYLY